ncbi:Regulator of chromosome condensation [Eumeta japonica]|uniref:Regulator of chromosome condensation n=1 Tax=Eumeta variegata TaxID=151549 RepID=A0A4C1SZ11_EUMVA|nr:Regulator of chromosome condensation [Eumeta japonica]
MPAARGVKRAATKASTASAASASKNKKKRAGVQLEVPIAPKRKGCVLTCGQGDVGQLGLGEEVVETNKFKLVSSLGSKIVDACAGGMHTVALDSEGNVWTFGCNDEGALGRTARGEAEEAVPGRVSLPEPAVAIAAGDSHTAALLQNGDVYAWGAFRDSHGSMGLVVQGREGKACREPAHIPIGKPAADIASGGDHLVILTTSGSVYTMGCGEQGQLGRLSQRSATRDARQGFNALLVPSKVMFRPGASRIWAGYHATFALDTNGEKVYAWGLNNYGQLGVSGEKRRAALFTPTECDAFTRGPERWAAVACGQHHSLALDAAGACYAVGRCEYGRLGLGSRSGDAETLEPIPKLAGKRCVSIAAGTSSSFAVTDKGEVYAWGMGSEGQLGTGGTEDAPEPSAVTALPELPAGPGKPVRASAGGQHTVLLIEDTSEPKTVTPDPVPKEQETQKLEDQEEDEPRPPKRQKKKEEETSSSGEAKADTVDAGPRPPEKFNGDETETAAMEVDDTDKKETDDDEDIIKDTQTDSATTAEEAQQASTKPAEDVSTEKAPQQTGEPDKPEPAAEQPMDTEPESPAAGDDDAVEAAPELNDVEMKPGEGEKETAPSEQAPETVNGNPETEEPPGAAAPSAPAAEKSKAVSDATIANDNALATTA